MVLYFGLINSPTVAKNSDVKMGFKLNLHKTDWRYSVKNYFIGFAKKFYPTLMYKQILKQQELFHFQTKYFNTLQYCSIVKSVKNIKI